MGQAAGRFTVPNADIALSTVAGGLLGLLRVHQHHPEQVDETSVDQLAEALLRMLGIPPAKPSGSPGAPSPTSEPGRPRPGQRAAGWRSGSWGPPVRRPMLAHTRSLDAMATPPAGERPRGVLAWRSAGRSPSMTGRCRSQADR